MITGETGSGKSILLNAINLLLGERADFTVIGKKSNKSFVEALFDMEERFEVFFLKNDLDQMPTITVRREIVKDGKSRAFINDTPVQLSILKELTSLLLSVNSQFNTYDLRSSQYQIELFDDMADTSTLRMNYTKEYHSWKSTSNTIQKLEEKRREQDLQNDYNLYLLEELGQLELNNTDFAAYELILNRMENADLIRELALEITNFSEENGVYTIMNSVVSKIEKISGVDPKMRQVQSQLKAILSELKEVINDAQYLTDDTESNPAELQTILKRVDEYNRQLNKHRFTSQQQLTELWETLKNANQHNEALGEEIASLIKENAKKELELHNAADNLHKKRSAAAQVIEKELSLILSDLKLKETKLTFELYPSTTLKENGGSDLNMLFSANKGMVLVPIEKAASGGEMSRVMLALQKIISEKRKLPTILFDEIDTGVSGDVAEKIGVLLRSMGKNRQLIAITHLPQVSAKANHHVKVEKDNQGLATQTQVRKLPENEIVVEIARLMSGEVITTEAILAAKNLMN